MTNYKKNKAFSLLEMSFTILILGILLIGGITFLSFVSDTSKSELTNKRMKDLKEAIGIYVLANNRLPCPSDLSIPNTSSDYGKENRNSSTYKCEISNTSGYFVSGNIIYGAVPTKDLHLTNDYGIDGWNSQLIYVVDKRFTNSYDGSIDEGFYISGGESIIIENISGVSNFSTNNIATNKAIYVLLSSGKNANAAFKEGTNDWNTSDVSLSEKENAYSSGTLNNIFVKDVSTSTFDDIVSYEEKKDIVLRLDMGNVQCSINDLTSIDKEYAKPSNSTLLTQCKNKLCEQGIEIQSATDCFTLNGGIGNIINSKNKPVRKCLEYGQWSDVMYPCIEGCNFNISDININENINNGISENQELLDKLGRIEATNQNVLVTVYCNALNYVGYVRLSCNETDKEWSYYDGYCIKTSCSSSSFNLPLGCIFSDTVDNEVSNGTVLSCVCENDSSTLNISCIDGFWVYSGTCSEYCENSLLNSEATNYTFSDTTGNTVSGIIKTATCNDGYVLSDPSIPVTASCGGDGKWVFNGSCVLGTSCENSLLQSSYAEFITFGSTQSGVQLKAKCIGDINQEITATCINGLWDYGTDVCPIICENSQLNPSNTIANCTFLMVTGITNYGFTRYCSCNSGYILEDQSDPIIATCSNNGGWVYSGGNCVASSCQNSLLSSSYANFSTTGTTENGVQLSAECLANSSQIITATCNGGLWNYSNGTCSMVCKNSLLNVNNTIPNSTFLITSGLTNYNSTQIASCNSGYTLLSELNPVIATCGNDGNWIYSGGSCEVSSDCSNSLLLTRYADFATSGTTMNGVQLTGKCLGNTSQSTTATCNNGTWTFSVGECPTVCSNNTLNNLNTVINSTFSTVTNFTYSGGYVLGNCNSGYDLIYGGDSIIASCENNGSWTFSGGPCRIPCLNSNLNFNYASFANEVGTTQSDGSITGSCLANASQTVTAYCSNGLWNYSSGSCAAVCENYLLSSTNPIANSTFSTIMGVTNSGFIQTGSCDDGYVLTDSSNPIKATCGNDGKWVFSGSSCSTACDNSELSYNYTEFNKTSGTTAVGGAVTGFCLGDSNTKIVATCNLGGIWSYNNGGNCPTICYNSSLLVNDVFSVFNVTTGVTVYNNSITGYCANNSNFTVTAFCESDGSWSFSGQDKCKVSCQNSILNDLNTISNSTFTNTYGITSTNKTESAICDSGYAIVYGGDNVYATCLSTGNWIFNGGPCGKICNNYDINSSLYSGFALTGTTNPGMSLSGSCIGLADNNVIARCEYDGTWSYTVDGISGNSCPILCPNYSLNSNFVNFVFNNSDLIGYSSSGTIKYASCLPGYSIVTGGDYLLTATCGSDKNWTYHGGPCGISCQNDQLFFNYATFETRNITTNPGSYAYGNCIAYPNNTISGYCEINGTWRYEGSPCNVACYNSDLNNISIIPYGTVFKTITGETVIGNTISGTCINYKNRKVTATCQSSGNWSFSSVNCN